MVLGKSFGPIVSIYFPFLLTFYCIYYRFYTTKQVTRRVETMRMDPNDVSGVVWAGVK
jgi:hypothetical protein